MKLNETRLRTFPLSSGQERLWFLAQLNPDSRAYNATKVLRLAGPLDRNILEQALNEIVRRHEILRTSFRIENDSPFQVVLPFAPRPLCVVPVPVESNIERKETLRRLMHENALQGFDLDGDGILRIILWQIAEDEHYFQAIVHHIAADGGSIGVFVSELAMLYNALLGGTSPDLPELPLQYGDYALTQRKFLETDEARRGMEYWKKQLAGANHSLDLCLDHRRPAHSSRDVGNEQIVLPSSFANAVRGLSARNRVTAFMTLLAGLGVLLQRYTGESDILIGVPATKRNQQTARLIGFFLNMLILRLDLKEDLSFQELLARVRRTALAAFAHQDVPLELLVKELQPTRYTDGQPFFQVMFIYSETQDAQPSMSGLDVTNVGLNAIPAKLDLSFYVNLAKKEPLLSCQYDVDLFCGNSIHRMLEHWGRLLQSAAENPLQKLSSLNLFTETEKYQLLYAWNHTSCVNQSQGLVHQPFERSTQKAPDALAVITRGEQITYRELDERANRVAHLLIQLGVRRGDLVAVYLDRSANLIVALLAVLKAGAAYVPLEVNYPRVRIVWILSSLSIRHALTTTSRKTALLAAPTVEHLICLESGKDIEQSQSTRGPRIWTQTDLTSCPKTGIECRAEPEDLAYIIFTSGSTGVPKGVMVAHAPVMNVIDWVNRTFAVNAQDRILCTSSVCFDLSVYDVFGVLAAGGSIYLVSQAEVSDPEALYSILVTGRITFWNSAPATLQQLSPFLDSARTDGETSDLRLAFLSGDWIPVNLPAMVRGKFPRARVIALGGATEAAIWSNYYSIDTIDPSWPSIPYGRPIQNAHYYILDEHLNPCPIGVRGDLYIGGDCLAYGYANQTNITSVAYIPDPFAAKAGSRLYRTGDRARWRADGNIEFLGRIDGQVKIRGFRVEIGEIENILARYPGIRDAVVTVGDDPAGEKCLIAFVVGNVVPDNALRSFLKEHLTDYMIPATFLQLEKLPLSANGKLDRKALPRPDWEHVLGNRQYEPPQTQVEVVLADFWMEALGLPRVGRSDNFFELGGHSLLATKLIFKIRSHFLIDISLRTLFDSPTLASLAAEINKVGYLPANPGGAIQPISRQGALSPSFSQERLWFLSQLAGPESNLYTIAGGIRLRGDLNVTAFSRAFNLIVERHEVLRTVFLSIDGRPVPKIKTEDLPELLVRDLYHLPLAEAQEQQKQICLEYGASSFNIAGEHLCKAVLIAVTPSEHVFVLAMHHAIGDGWSIQVFLQELKTFYEQLNKGTSPDLPSLSIQYVDFASWQRTQLTREAMEPHLAFWKRRFGSDVPVLNLPLDRPRPTMQGIRGDREGVILSPDMRKAIEDLSTGSSATLFQTLLSSFYVLLYRYTGQTDITIGIPVSGRMQAELEPLIGCFVNTLAIRVSAAGEMIFKDLLAQVREATLDAYAHAEIPFEAIVDHLGILRDVSRNPLFQVMFSYGEDLGGSLELDGIVAERLDLRNHAAKFDLTLWVADTGHNLHCSLEYKTDFFDLSTVQRILRHWKTLLGSIVADPNQYLFGIALLESSERLQLLAECSGAIREILPALFPAMFESQVEITPGRTAIEYSGQQITYSELNRRANVLAWHLMERGVGPEVPVAVCMGRCPELLTGLLAVLKAGAAFVPLDPEYPDERLQEMLHDSHGPFLLTERLLAPHFTGFEGHILCLDDNCFSHTSSELNPAVRVVGENMAYMMYTSASTGKSKAVIVPHFGLANYIQHCIEEYFLGPGKGVPLHSSIGFDLTITTLLAPLAVGDCVLLAPKGHSLAVLNDLIRTEPEFKFIKLTPSHLDLLRHSLQAEDAGDMAGALIIGGEELHREDLSFFERHAPHMRLINEYGPTEAVVGCCIYDAMGTTHVGTNVPIGKPISGVQLYVLDDAMGLVPPGCSGELFIGGDSLARGYHGKPAETAEAFLPDSFSGRVGLRLYKTGDLARRRSDGNLEFLGRKDLQLKVRGIRVEPSEIEAALCRYPRIDQALVIGGSCRLHGSLVAYFVSQSCASPANADLRDYLLGLLPAHMVPSVFVPIAEFPLTAHGKIDRAALPVPRASSAKDVETDFPANAIEEGIIRIWKSLLDINRINLTANYFDLGGNSLQLVQVHKMIQSSLDVQFPLIDLFKYPTVRSLSRYLAGKREAEPSSSIMEQTQNAEARRRIELLRASKQNPAQMFVQN